MQKVCEESAERASNCKTLKEQFIQVNTKMIEFGKEMRTKLAEKEYEKDQ